MNYRNAKFNEFGTIDCEIEIIEGEWIPATLRPDTDNQDIIDAYDDAIQRGDVAAYVAPVLTVEDVVYQINQAVESMITQLVADNGYTSRLNYSKYVGYDNLFRANAEALGAYEAGVWSYCEQQISLLENGGRAVPTPEAFLTELPVFGG